MHIPDRISSDYSTTFFRDYHLTAALVMVDVISRVTINTLYFLLQEKEIR